MNAVTEASRLAPDISGIDIPPCPAILIELQAELGKESFDQREIAYLVSRDVALSGQIMQFVNSAAFGNAGGRITSVMQAINLLGARQLFGIVVGQLLRIALSDNSGASMERFWESSAQTARLSAEVAKRLRCIRPDVAYTFGLFHDCGIPLLMKRFDNAREVLAEANRTADRMFTEVEDSRLGTNHAVVGYFLARRWRMPDIIAEAVLLHHDYGMLDKASSTTDEVRHLVATCVLAEHVIRLHTQDDGEQEWDKAASAVCAHFNLSLGAVDDLIEDLRDWLG